MAENFRCGECGQRVTGKEFHPHLFCVLYKGGVTDQRTYLRWALEGGSVLKALDLIPFPFIDAPLTPEKPRRRTRVARSGRQP